MTHPDFIEPADADPSTPETRNLDDEPMVCDRCGAVIEKPRDTFTDGGCVSCHPFDPTARIYPRARR